MQSEHLDLVCEHLKLDCKIDWLAENEACDLLLDTELPAHEISAQAIRALGSHQIDAVCTPVAGRRKKILISDMDSTMIDQECIDELGEYIGVGPAIRKITQNVINGNIGFSEALRQRIALMKGMPENVLDTVYNERLSVKPGARQLVQTMRKSGAYCILVSGGFSFFTSRFAARIGFHDHAANHLDFEDGRLTGEVHNPILGRTAKLDTLNRLCQERNLTPGDVLAVWDGANDIKMISAAGLGVAFRGSASLKNQANALVDHADLTALLYIQGYRKSEFVNS
ncbi:MAG: phosphoserine phosphatase SerB [Paracoccaceae bacterium]